MRNEQIYKLYWEIYEEMTKNKGKLTCQNMNNIMQPRKGKSDKL
jgi:hypothetical protein